MAPLTYSPLNIVCLHTFKPTLLLISIMAMALPSYGESFTAKRTGQGFTGLTQDFTSSLSNPALLTKFDNYDDIFFSLNIGIMASDKYDVVDTTKEISDNLDNLAKDINGIQSQNFQSTTQVKSYYDDLNQQVDDIIADFKKIDNKVVKVRNGLNFQMIIPNQYLSFGLFTNQYGRIAGTLDYSEDDEKTLNDAILSANLNLNDLASATTTLGYSIAEAGVMAAYPAIKQANYDFSIGAKLKYQRIDLYYNSGKINEFDDDDFEISNDENITDKSGSNVDLGLYLTWGAERQWHAALVSNNLLKKTVYHVEQNITFTLKNSTVFGLSYQNSWLSLATEIDLTDRAQFAALAASKYAGVGAEFRFYEHIQFRLGYRTDLNEIDDDIYTAGIGISPWAVFAIDIAAFTGDNDTIGAALQLSLKI
ncbi:MULTISPECIES: conjugal transfer protein TraF [Colwellia]|uniref:Conjugal transfer protein TraF n=1 Tax=Colwellia marinimaniae TaxID=1513592 RepID=A0ABQ0MQ28_9GAMM|nr:MULTISPECIES: conjugal transfer protein TraF [Colwellia]GAW94486.1 conjugal transfer protein TraF [Colwellia marinimaniae]